MLTVKHKILVLSGKGGVGKSTFSAHLGHALASDASKEVSRSTACLVFYTYKCKKTCRLTLSKSAPDSTW